MWCMRFSLLFMFFLQAEDGIRDLVRSRGLGDVYKRQNEIGALVQRAEQATVDFLDRGPARRGFYSLWKGMALHNAGRVASAMAFNLFLAAIPMLALGGYLAATLLRQSQDALDLMSLYMDLSPLEVHQIVQRHFKRFSGGAVAPVAILGSLWLASNAFYMLTVSYTHLTLPTSDLV